MTQSPGILYHPSKASSFGHSSVPRDPVKAWRQTQAFLEEFTHHKLRPGLELKIYSNDQWCDPAVSAQCKAEATALFGDPNVRVGEACAHWVLAADVLDRAADFALQDVSRPEQQIGPTQLIFTYDFHWKRHATFPAIDAPGAGSRISVFHGARRLFLQPTFVFPFESTSTQLLSFIAELQQHLPFKLREACFKSILPTTDGKSCRMRKLVPGWLSI